jgi:hypothetical protein
MEGTLPAPSGLRGRIRAFRTQHPRAQPLAFFAAGFVFDAVMVKRIDETPVLIQQGVYLLVVGFLVAVGLRMQHLQIEPPWGLRRVWKWSDHAVHFMLGTLLNAYMIFYVKSGSGFTALLFAAVIAGLLAVNEMPRFHRYGPLVVVGLYSFSLTSYFAYLFPVLLGSLRSWMFVLAVFTSTLPVVLLAQGVQRWGGGARNILRQTVAPALAVQALLLGLYIARLIPPVPLAVRSIGIYHGVERDAVTSSFLLTHQSPGWKFWRKDDRHFLARTGDRIYCFVEVFAPSRFKDRVWVRWSYKHPEQGWQPSGALPIVIVGGREEGFRGYGYKGNYRPGDWRVAVETEDGREIGGISFTVENDADPSPREMLVDHG